MRIRHTIAAKAALLLLVACLTGAYCGGAGVFNQPVRRVSSTSGGVTFAYFDPDLVDATCDAKLAGSGSTNFSVFVVPTKEILAILLTAQSTGKSVPFMYVSTGNTPSYLPGYGSTGTCKIESLDMGD